MAASHISGPSVVYGELAGTSAGTNPEAGPSANYQGDAVLDVRFPVQPGMTGRGVVKSFMDSPYVASVDAVPSTFSPTAIAAAQTATSGTPMTLAAASSIGIGVNFPIVPFGKGDTAVNVVPVLALDPGFTTVATTAGSPIVTMAAGQLPLFARMVRGLSVMVGAGPTSWTLARVVSASAGAITLDTPMPATNAAAVIGLANGQFRADRTPVAAHAHLTAGAVAMFDPRSGLSRGTSVTTSAANAGGTVTISGYDVFFNPMSETIACAAAGTFYGNKCFKYVSSVVARSTAGGALSGTVSVGTSDLFGFAIRSDAYEYTNVYWNGAFMGSSAGWYPADVTSPATSSTKDVRSAVQASAIGPNATAIGAAQSNGARRLQLYMSIPNDNLAFATPSNPAPMFGVTQA